MHDERLPVSTMESDWIIVNAEKKVARLTLNNPEKLNTFTVERLVELERIFEDLEKNRKVKTVIIDAVGEKAFSAGLDTTMLTSGDGDIKTQVLEAGTKLSLRMFYFPKPIIASIAAPAVGWGCIISMLADYRYIIDSAYFKLPELEIGIYPATGALTLCMMHFGPSIGNEVLFLSKKVSAKDAARIGFVNGTGATREEVDKRAKKTAKTLSRLNRQVAMFSKINTRLLQNMEFNKALTLEKKCFNDLMDLAEADDWYEKYLQAFKDMQKEYA